MSREQVHAVFGLGSRLPIRLGPVNRLLRFRRRTGEATPFEHAIRNEDLAAPGFPVIEFLCVIKYLTWRSGLRYYPAVGQRRGERLS